MFATEKCLQYTIRISLYLELEKITVCVCLSQEAVSAQFGQAPCPVHLHIQFTQNSAVECPSLLSQCRHLLCSVQLVMLQNTLALEGKWIPFQPGSALKLMLFSTSEKYLATSFSWLPSLLQGRSQYFNRAEIAVIGHNIVSNAVC